MLGRFVGRGGCVLAWMALTGCVANYQATERDISHFEQPAPGAKRAVAKWEGPWMEAAIGRFKATFFYGPWQGNQRWMDSCQRQCAEEGHALKGCMWLADIKYDYEGRILTSVEAGTRYALWHCCCDYPTLKTADKEVLRKKWESAREALRRAWGKIYGEWPKSGGKTNWPGHHMRDLWHGGEPTDLANVMPTPPDVHVVFNDEYPLCYAGGGQWSTVGPDLPYTDN